MPNILDNTFLGGAYSDPEISSILSKQSCLMAIIEFEISVAKVQGELGLIPVKNAKSIQKRLKAIKVSDLSCHKFLKADGIIVPELVKYIRQEYLSIDDSKYLHWGLTSQDAIDSARCLQLKDYFNVLESRLNSFLNLGAEKAQDYKYVTIASHTRGQVAGITSLGAKLSTNFFPILNQNIKLSKLKLDVLQVSLGGASGTSNTFKDLFPVLLKGVAKELNLSAPTISWHNNREGFVELGSILTIICSCFGKFGADILWMNQSEIQEMELSTVGKSSAMPHKQNPIIPEILMSLADIANALNGLLGSSMLHKNERDGVAWTKEIIALEQIMYCAGTACGLGLKLLQTVNPRRDNIDRNFERNRGLIFAESAVTFLSSMYKDLDASSIVSEAIKNVNTNQSTLLVELEKLTEQKVDFSKVFDPVENLGQAPEIVRIFCNKVRNTCIN